MNVLLYYCYTKIDDTEKYCQEHINFCQNFDLTGRIIIRKPSYFILLTR